MRTSLLPLALLPVLACGPGETLQTLFEGVEVLDYATLLDGQTLFMADDSTLWKLDLATDDAEEWTSRSRKIYNLVSGFGMLAWIETNNGSSEIWAMPASGAQAPFQVASDLMENTEIAVADDGFYWLNLRELWTGGQDLQQTSMVELIITDPEADMLYPLSADLTVAGGQAWFKVYESYDGWTYAPLWTVSTAGGLATRIFEDWVDTDKGVRWVVGTTYVADQAWLLVDYTAAAGSVGVTGYDLYRLLPEGPSFHSELGAHYRDLAALDDRLFLADNTDVQELAPDGTWQQVLGTNASLTQLFTTDERLVWTTWERVMATELPESPGEPQAL